MSRPKPNHPATGSIQGGYLSFNEGNMDSVFRSYGNVVDRFNGVLHSVASTNEIVTDVSYRAPFDRSDYDRFRPNEMHPRKFKDLVLSCRHIYRRVGIVREVINLMTDFACEDLEILHIDPSAQAFLNVWAKKIDLKAAAEEFVRHFLVDGNTVVKRVTARLSKPVERDMMENVKASPDINVRKPASSVDPREIPWRYIFLNVANLEWLGGEVARLAGLKKLGFRMSKRLVSKIKSPSGKDMESEIVKNLPADIRKQMANGISGSNLIELDMDKLYIAHYKKDSWDMWASPFLEAILPDIMFKDKLRMADMAALDGVINVIRIWKLGDHKEGVLPDDGAISKLINILEANVGGGAMDIVWDSMIDMEPYYPPIGDILGPEKYEQVNKDILIGLGVPEVLLGGSGSNFSNSFIQLKTIVEKLEYVRQELIKWIDKEVKLVCKAMNIDTLPKVKFNHMNLHDENIHRKLIVGLMDRGILSVESVLKAYGEDFLIEIERVKQESSMFKKEGIELHNPLEKPDPGAGQGSGRPALTKDGGGERKQRRAEPRTSAVFAMEAIKSIEDHVFPAYMESWGVSDARRLTADQRKELDEVRVVALACINKGDDISKDNILSTVESGKYDTEVINAAKIGLAKFAADTGKNPTIQQKHLIEAIAWSIAKGE